MAIGALVLLLMTGVLLAVTGQMWLSATLVLGLVTFLGVASNLKFVVRREPLYPSDFAFIREPEFLLTMVEPRVLWLTLLGLVPIVAFSWGLGKALQAVAAPTPLAGRTVELAHQRPRLHGWPSVGLSVVMLSSLLQFNHHGNPWRRAFESAGAQWAKASQPVNYAHNGFLGGFLYNLDIPAMRRSSEYTRANMERIVAKYTADAEKLNKSRSPHALDDVNVVSVLSESFSDPTLLKGMKLAQDPIPRTRALMQRVPHGLMYSRKPGGGTSSVEFETLTGMSLAQFNPAMDTPYQMLIPNYPTFPSAVEMFNQMGHKTLAIHPFTGSMYQRDRVYPILGFSDFKDRTEMDYRGKVEENPYISDRAAFRQTLDAIDTQDQPVFVNLVTMQNHMPYRGKYADPIGIEGLDERDADLMSQYSRGLSYSDQAMSEFIQQLDRSREKTIIVFYGDHVPGGTPRSLFKKNTRLAMHQTPFFMYSNFGQVQPKEFPTTSPDLLPAQPVRHGERAAAAVLHAAPRDGASHLGARAPHDDQPEEQEVVSQDPLA